MYRNRFVPDSILDAGRGGELQEYNHSGCPTAPWYDEGDGDRTSGKKFGMSLLISKRATELRSLPEDAQSLLALTTGSH